MNKLRPQLFTTEEAEALADKFNQTIGINIFAPKYFIELNNLESEQIKSHIYNHVKQDIWRFDGPGDFFFEYTIYYDFEPDMDDNSVTVFLDENDIIDSTIVRDKELRSRYYEPDETWVKIDRVDKNHIEKFRNEINAKKASGELGGLLEL